MFNNGDEMQVFARTSFVPEGCGYITRGRLYPVTEEFCIGTAGLHAFRSQLELPVQATGPVLCLWQDCSHLDGRDWERVTAEDRVLELRQYINDGHTDDAMAIAAIRAEIQALEEGRYVPKL